MIATTADAAMTLLRARGLCVGYGRRGTKRAVVTVQELAVQQGTFVCLLGPNGAGKSTLLRTLARLQPALSGVVEIGGRDLSTLSQAALARSIAVVLTERVSIDALRARELVALGRYAHAGWWTADARRDAPIVDEALRLVDAWHLADRPILELSDGERQRVMIARALAQQPALLLLDEPTAFLDAPSRVDLMHLAQRLARTQGLAVVMSTHDVDLAMRTADTVWLLSRDGRFTSVSPHASTAASQVAAAFDRHECPCVLEGPA